MNADPARIPVIVGVGQVNDRPVADPRGNGLHRPDGRRGARR